MNVFESVKYVISVRRMAANVPNKLLVFAVLMTLVNGAGAGSDQQVVNALSRQTSGVNSVTFAPYMQSVASVSGELGKVVGEVELWGGVSRQELRTFCPTTSLTDKDVYSPDGKWMVTAGTAVNSLEPYDEPETLTFQEHQSAVTRAVFSPDGKRIASIDRSSIIKVWSADDGTKEFTVPSPHTRPLPALYFATPGSNLEFSPDGKRLALAVGKPEIRVLNSLDGSVLQSLGGDTEDVGSVAYSGDGKLLASKSDKAIRIWDALKGQQVRLPIDPTGSTGCLALSPDGKRLASVSGTEFVNNAFVAGDVTVWDVETGRELRTLKGLTSWIWSVAFSPDGKQLAAASGYLGNGNGREVPPGMGVGEVMVWDIETGQKISKLCSPMLPAFGIAYSPDGKKLAAASGGASSGSVYVWDTADGIAGKKTQVLNGHAGLVMSVSFSPDAQRLASASADSTVKVWHLAP
jgi:WD40 repeat protein